jgi:hypothetical protein
MSSLAAVSPSAVITRGRLWGWYALHRPSPPDLAARPRSRSFPLPISHQWAVSLSFSCVLSTPLKSSACRSYVKYRRLPSRWIFFMDRLVDHYCIPLRSSSTKYWENPNSGRVQSALPQSKRQAEDDEPTSMLVEHRPRISPFGNPRLLARLSGSRRWENMRARRTPC